MTTTLVTTGILCLIAAIVGGGLSGFGIQLPLLQSVRRQLLLGTLGICLIVAGMLAEIAPLPGPPTPTPVPPAPVVKVAPVTGDQMLRTSSGGIMAATTFRASGCLSPTKPGRALVRGSGGVTDVISNANVVYDGKSLPGRNAAQEAADPSPYYNGGWHVTKDTPELICIELFARTSAKEANVQYNAKLTALEEYKE